MDFLSFLSQYKVLQVIKILPCGKQGPIYLPWLLVTWGPSQYKDAVLPV